MAQTYKEYSIDARLLQYQQNIEILKEQFRRQMNMKIDYISSLISPLSNQFNFSMAHNIKIAESKFQPIYHAFEINSPKDKNKKGFAQVVYKERVIDLSLLEKEQTFHLMNDHTNITAKVIKKEKI